MSSASALPASVTVCPGCAQACAELAGVPLVVVAVTPVSAGPKGSLVPPTVATRIGPVGAPVGTVRLMPELVPNTSSPLLRAMSSTRSASSSTALAPSAKPVPVSCRLAPMKPPPAPMPMLLSVGTICSSNPVLSRSRRTRPVVAVPGTAALIVWLTRSIVGVTVVSPRLPLVLMVVKIRRSLARSPLPPMTMVCPVLAEARPALAGVPLAAVAVMPDSRLPPASTRSIPSV